MRGAAQRWGRGLALAACLLPAARAQTVPAPAPVAPGALPRPDSLQSAAPTFVADTARHVTVVTAEPTDAVTRPLALRIGVAIALLTITTLLLYNVRSR
ncbi:MAG TPA: hypothetical protein VF629_04895 [Hymenobacter sp.]|jgi:hypothetical protein|uniref:hypothetical protein n=1 Tax=Hymenobacter sp. TaxID=1898978 RepID=UPI002EDA3890